MTKPSLHIIFDPPDDITEDQLIGEFANQSMQAFLVFLKSWRQFKQTEGEEE